MRAAKAVSQKPPPWPPQVATDRRQTLQQRASPATRVDGQHPVAPAFRDQDVCPGWAGPEGMFEASRDLARLARRIEPDQAAGCPAPHQIVRPLGVAAAQRAVGDRAHAVSMHGMTETRRQCEATGLPQGLRVTTHLADVSSEADVMRFRDEAADQQATDRIHLLFNNAGIGGGGSMVANSRDEWERTFNICWGGVYLGTRAFLPLLQAADEAHIVNTSSMNGFWASVGPGAPHTAYSAAKFAVKDSAKR